MEVPYTIKWISAVLWALPAPTQTWVDIIGHLVWPSLVAFLVVRFRRFLRMFLNTIIRRAQTDHMKLGPFEMTPNSDVIVLDREHSDDSTVDLSPEDTERIEKIFEFIADTSNMLKLVDWMNKNLDDELEIWDFVTLPEYATEREMAYKALAIGGM